MSARKLPLIIATFISLVPVLTLRSQQLTYSSAEVYAIKDSIHRTRWDFGGPISNYSFRFMSEFFPVAFIENDPSRQFLHPEKPMPQIENLKIKSDNQILSFDEYLKTKHVNAFIVTHKGNVVYEKYFLMKPDEMHTLQSCTKVVTSMLIAQLENEKKIDTNLPVETYLPELSNTAWNGTLVKDILNMRSGMVGSETSQGMTGFTDPAHPYYSFEEALGVLPKVDSVRKSVFDYVASMERRVPAGQEAEYHSMNTFVLGWIAEKISGKSYADLVTERIWKPMGASSKAYVCLSEKGVPWTHGGISATLRDFARFGTLFTRSEMEAHKERFISRAQLDRIFSTPQTDFGFMKFQWGYQWDWARDGMMMKGGFGGQALLIDPERDLVIACFNHIDKDWMKDTMISFEAVNEIRKLIDSTR